jgi:hypothetical protein
MNLPEGRGTSLPFLKLRKKGVKITKINFFTIDDKAN